MNERLSLRGHHEAWVAGWLDRAGDGKLRPAQRLALFDQAFAAVWRRAGPTLGELTLSATADRALRASTASFAQLAALRLEPSGISFQGLREGGRGGCDAELGEALQFFLVELLAAFGNLTGEALTPILHRELAKGEPEIEGAVPTMHPQVER